MAEKLKIQGVNATLTVDDEHVCLERKKGPSILDYLGNPITEIAYVDLARFDLRRQKLVSTGLLPVRQEG